MARKARKPVGKAKKLAAKPLGKVKNLRTPNPPAGPIPIPYPN